MSHNYTERCGYLTMHEEVILNLFNIMQELSTNNTTQLVCM